MIELKSKIESLRGRVWHETVDDLLKCLEEHDKQVRADAIEELSRAMYHEAFEVDHEKDGMQKWDSGNWIRYKLFENVLQQLKGAEE